MRDGLYGLKMPSMEEFYPSTCPFCTISTAYSPSPYSIPTSPNPEATDPQCHLLLSTSNVLAFLDILPIAPGHILLTTRTHYEKLSDLYTPGTPSAVAARDDARALGEWLPILSCALRKVTGIEDWNIVQNNGERAAQVVPHVHFHLIPRYQEGRERGKGKVDERMLKSWKMFGRGAREELDDEEGRVLAGELREALRVLVGAQPVDEVKAKL